jgi:hypothetical protein
MQFALGSTVFQPRSAPSNLAPPKLNRGMKVYRQVKQGASGKVGWVVLWLLGVPIPILLILFLLRGCT